MNLPHYHHHARFVDSVASECYPDSDIGELAPGSRAIHATIGDFAAGKMTKFNNENRIRTRRPFSASTGAGPAAVALALALAVSATSCSSPQPPPAEGTSLRVTAVGALGSTNTQEPAPSAPPTWQLRVGDRFELRCTEVLEYRSEAEGTGPGSGANSLEPPSLIQSVERRVVLEVVREEPPKEPKLSPTWRLAMQQPHIHLQPTPDEAADGIGRALEAVEIEYSFDDTRTYTALASAPPKSAAIDAWRLLTLVSLVFTPPPPSENSKSTWQRTSSVHTGAKTEARLQISTASTVGGSTACADGSSACTVISSRVAFQLEQHPQQHGAGAVEVSLLASASGNGSVLWRIRRGQDALDGAIFRAEETLRTTRAKNALLVTTLQRTLVGTVTAIER